MRNINDIEFRGKAIRTYDNKSDGKWIYGDFFMDGTDAKIKERVKATFSIDPETAGQWTGLRDKNGAKIFEGDIVLYKGMRCLVRWDEKKAGFFIGEDKYWMMNDTDIEIIGNVYDNTELRGGVK